MVSTSDMIEIRHKLEFMPEYEYKKLDKKEVLYLTLGMPYKPEKPVDFKHIRKPLGGDFVYFSHWHLYEYSLVLFDMHKEPCMILGKDSIAFKTFVQILAQMKARRKKNKLVFAKVYFVSFENKISKEGKPYVMTDEIREYYDEDEKMPQYEELGGE